MWSVWKWETTNARLLSECMRKGVGEVKKRLPPMDNLSGGQVAAWRRPYRARTGAEADARGREVDRLDLAMNFSPGVDDSATQTKYGCEQGCEGGWAVQVRISLKLTHPLY